MRLMAQGYYDEWVNVSATTQNLEEMQLQAHINETAATFCRA